MKVLNIIEQCVVIILNDLCWVVIVVYDGVVDGVFFYLVKMIGVYCWFFCGVWVLWLENVEFYLFIVVVEWVGFWFCCCCWLDELLLVECQVVLVVGFCCLIDVVDLLFSL